MCGARVGGRSLDGVDTGAEAVIEGVVRAGGSPVAGAYVRLLDTGGEFTAEVPTDADGAFRLFARPGRWTVRVLAPGREPAQRAVVADTGAVATLDVDV